MKKERRENIDLIVKRKRKAGSRQKRVGRKGEKKLNVKTGCNDSLLKFQHVGG
jgi:hypothetical protein